jgi:hypothetical protein
MACQPVVEHSRSGRSLVVVPDWKAHLRAPPNI